MRCKGNEVGVKGDGLGYMEDGLLTDGMFPGIQLLDRHHALVRLDRCARWEADI
jgi:hypothetical protein